MKNYCGLRLFCGTPSALSMQIYSRKVLILYICLLKRELMKVYHGICILITGPYLQILYFLQYRIDKKISL